MLASLECWLYVFAGYSAAACVERVGGPHTRDEEMMMMTLMMTLMMTSMCNGDDDDDDQHDTVMYAIRMLEYIYMYRCTTGSAGAGVDDGHAMEDDDAGEEGGREGRMDLGEA